MSTTWWIVLALIWLTVLGLGLRGLATGWIYGRNFMGHYRWIARADEPVRYWLAIAAYLIAPPAMAAGILLGMAS